MDRLQELLDRSTVIFEASQADHWGGKILDASGTPSPLFKRFIHSLHVNLEFDNCGLSHPGYTSPKALLWLLDNFLDSGFPLSNEEKAYLTAPALDSLVTSYYVAMGMDYMHMIFPNGSNRKIPFLNLKGFTWWILVHLHAGSDPMRQLLNKLLKTPERPIIDPDTRQPFVAIQIPKSSLPSVDPECVEFLKGAQLKWAETRKAIIDRAKLTPAMGLGSAQMGFNTAQNIHMQTMASMQASLAAQSAWNARQNVALQSWGNF